MNKLILLKQNWEYPRKRPLNRRRIKPPALTRKSRLLRQILQQLLTPILLNNLLGPAPKSQLKPIRSPPSNPTRIKFKQHLYHQSLAFRELSSSIICNSALRPKLWQPSCTYRQKT